MPLPLANVSSTTAVRIQRRTLLFLASFLRYVLQEKGVTPKDLIELCEEQISDARIVYGFRGWYTPLFEETLKIYRFGDHMYTRTLLSPSEDHYLDKALHELKQLKNLAQVQTVLRAALSAEWQRAAANYPFPADLKLETLGKALEAGNAGWSS